MGSITKTMVATVVLQLVGAGLVPNGAAITVRQLLNHTSGIFNYTDDPAFLGDLFTDPTQTRSPQSLVAVATAHPPLFPPGADWSYSNTNYILAGLIIQAATGHSPQRELNRRIFTPLGLHGSSFRVTDRRHQRLLDQTDYEKPLELKMTDENLPNRNDERSWIENQALPNVVVLGAVVTLIVGLVFFWLFAHGLGIDQWYQFWDPRLTGGDLYDVMRSTVAATAVLAGAIATVVALRRQITNERKLDLDRDASELAIEQDRRARYVKAVELLGHESPTIRLGGIFSLDELSLEWTDLKQQQMCVDVLCSYIRLHPTIADTDISGSSVVRATIERLIVSRLKKGSQRHWGAVDIDLQGAELSVPVPYKDLDVGGAIDFSSCRFIKDPKFERCTFHSDASFLKATFDSRLSMTSVTFNKRLSFEESDFVSSLHFTDLTLEDGISVWNCKFQEPWFNTRLEIRGEIWIGKCRFADTFEMFNSRASKAALIVADTEFNTTINFSKSKFDSTGQDMPLDILADVLHVPRTPASVFTWSNVKFGIRPSVGRTQFIGSDLVTWNITVAGNKWEVFK